MNKMTRLLGCAVVAAALLGTAFAGVAADGKKLIVNINKSGTQQYFIDQANGFTAAAKELGYEASTINVELDANLAISAITDAIAAGAKGIAITVPDQAVGPAIAKAAADAGLLLVATNDNISDAAGNPIPLVGFDGKDMGTKVGIAASDLLTKSGWLAGGNYGILSVEVQTLSVCNDRTNASRDEVTKAGADAARIFPVAYDGTTNSSPSYFSLNRLSIRSSWYTAKTANFLLSSLSGPSASYVSLAAIFPMLTTSHSSPSISR